MRTVYKTFEGISELYVYLKPSRSRLELAKKLFYLPDNLEPDDWAESNSKIIVRPIIKINFVACLEP